MIKTLWRKLVLPIDPWLFLFVCLIFSLSLFLLYSASNRDMKPVVDKAISFAIACSVMWCIANIPQNRLMQWAAPTYATVMILLVCVPLFGDLSHGGRRWLNLGLVRIQPSELMKVALPMMLAWFFHRFESVLCWKHFIIATITILFPVALITYQPDLGTALLLGASGFYVLYFAGLSLRLVGIIALSAGILAWAVMDWDICVRLLPHPYQCQRVATLLDPMSDRLGKGYQIIQGTIAIGSGGIFGRGWLNGTQTHLDFIPERTTDFIFSVYAEEFGLLGNIVLLLLYLMVVIRGLTIASYASTLFGQLLAGAVTMTFLTYAFVNIGMVVGILPVVGVPLPLISYGGTSLVSLFAGFGLLMGIQKDKKLMKG